MTTVSPAQAEQATNAKPPVAIPTPPTMPLGFWEGDSYQFDVNYYAVYSNNDVVVDGRVRQITALISPNFATVEQAREFQTMLLQDYPNCMIKLCIGLYVSIDDRDREELLDRIVWPEQTRPYERLAVAKAVRNE